MAPFSTAHPILFCVIPVLPHPSWNHPRLIYSWTNCWFVARSYVRRSHHVSELPKAAKNKIPDPMTNAAFFTESHRPPEPSWEDKKQQLCAQTFVTLRILCNPMLFELYQHFLQKLLTVPKTTLRPLLEPERSLSSESDNCASSTGYTDSNKQTIRMDTFSWS